jgi:hypothetical protein
VLDCADASECEVHSNIAPVPDLEKVAAIWSIAS